MKKKNKKHIEKILFIIFISLIIVVLILLILVLNKNKEKNANKINILIDEKKKVTKKIDISNLGEKEIREYELIIKSNRKETINYNIKFNLQNENNYILKVFKKSEQENLLNNKMSIDNIEFQFDGQNASKFIIIIRKIGEMTNSKYLEISVNR